MKLFLIAALLLFPSACSAYVVEVGAAIGEVDAAMIAAKYGAAAPPQVAMQHDRKFSYWSVDDGSLDVAYSPVSRKVIGIWFVHFDGRPKSQQKNLYLEVKRFDTKTGEMLIQTKRK